MAQPRPFESNLRYHGALWLVLPHGPRRTTRSQQSGDRRATSHPSRVHNRRRPLMNCNRVPLAVMLLALWFPSPATRAQGPAVAPEPPGAILRVEGDVSKPLEMTATEIARLPRQAVRARDHEGKEATFEGVALIEVLKKAGVKFGKDLRGPALATYLLVEAS